MSCPVCFFRNNYQNDLKRKTFGIGRFENKMRKYQDYFLSDISNMQSQSNCECASLYNNKEMIKWTDSFLNTLKKSADEINAAFGSLISVYEDYICKSSKVAADNLWKYLSNQGLLSETESVHSYTKLLFRARVQNGFDKKDPTEYFHIPFSKRHLVKSQRFSVSGQPMLYFGSSVLAVFKEMESDFDKLAVAGFLPKYPDFYGQRIFSLKNHINDSIENALLGIFEAGGNASFLNGFIRPNLTTISNDIHESVLMHLCTFPTEFKNSFIPEYIIPQLLTTALLEHGYAGLVFPSTKNFCNLNGQHRFSTHQMNIGIFVPYDPVNDLNKTMFQKFTIFPNINNDFLNVTKTEVVTKAQKIVDITKMPNANNNDYIIPLAQFILHIEYISNSILDGIPYFDTRIGKTELGLYLEMLEYLESKIK